MEPRFITSVIHNAIDRCLPNGFNGAEVYNLGVTVIAGIVNSVSASMEPGFITSVIRYNIKPAEII